MGVEERRWCGINFCYRRRIRKRRGPNGAAPQANRCGGCCWRRLLAGDDLPKRGGLVLASLEAFPLCLGAGDGERVEDGLGFGFPEKMSVAADALRADVIGVVEEDVVCVDGPIAVGGAEIRFPALGVGDVFGNSNGSAFGAIARAGVDRDGVGFESEVAPVDTMLGINDGTTGTRGA